jgi:membrane-associated phospholipid phosphatase
LPPEQTRARHQERRLLRGDAMTEMKFHATLTVLAGINLVLSVYGMAAANITVLPSPLLLRVGFLVLPLVGVAFCRWSRLERPLNLFIMIFWSMLFSNLVLPPMYVLARQHVELNDALLARMDTLLGIEVPDVLRVMEQFPAVGRMLDICYDSLVFLTMLAITIPPLCGRMHKAKEYALACVVSVAIGMPMFAAWQAVGPWSYYGYPPSPPQAEAMREFFALKADGGFVLNLSDTNGLVCFPSFHTILALLAGTTLWAIPYLRWPSAVLAVLIILSTLTTGWHYVIDVVAGTLVAIVALTVAKGYLWLEPRITLAGLLGAPDAGSPCEEVQNTPSSGIAAS